MPESVRVPSERAAIDSWHVVETLSQCAVSDPEWSVFRSALQSEIERLGGSLTGVEEVPADAVPAVVIGM